MSELSDIPLRRRAVLKSLAALGVGTAVFQRALAARAAEAGKVTPEMIRDAEWITGLTLTDEERASTAANVERSLASRQLIREFPVDYAVPPALHFHPAPAQPVSVYHRAGRVELRESAEPRRPDAPEDIAFLPVTELAALVRARQLTSLELTKIYLERLKRYDPALKCIVTLTEDLALRQAAEADREISAGRYRGPLHGIPWGAKDLIAYPGYKTTWGAGPFKDQVLTDKATVAQRLDDAGAVLVAKLSLGALAWGDEWFGGMTRNPWNTREGSSGSSAGSACAAAAGLVGFTLGSETLGSIVSPSLRCGASGLRPTFGRVSRHGCMALAWSMDKIGPICRTVEDCALVFGAIHGYDGLDPTAVDHPFAWPPARDLRTLRVGYFDNGMPIDERADLAVLRELGVTLVRVQLPEKVPAWALTLILNVESAAVFSPLVRAGKLEGTGLWPNELREGQFVTAIEYLQAQRMRTLLMRDMEKLFETVDCTIGGDDLTITNLTGHPSVAIPTGFEMRGGRETPVGMSFVGRLYEDESLLSLAHAYQTATGVHLRRPPLEASPDDAE
jgi:Asp-tRNA(Asn)/Glu-tRNA(Gln) amidotransferase A subunit family amidase